VHLRNYSPLISHSAPNEEVDVAPSSDVPGEEVCVLDEWGENCVKDWSGQRTAAYSSEAEDLGEQFPNLELRKPRGDTRLHHPRHGHPHQLPKLQRF
jgi:hypothetical protein